MTIVNAILMKEQHVLAVKRNTQPYKGMYALPGGHVETGETKHEALIREIKEEINSEIRIEKHVGTVTERNMIVHFYTCKIIQQEPCKPNEEIADVKWMSIPEFIENLKQHHVESWEELEHILHEQSSQVKI